MDNYNYPEGADNSFAPWNHNDKPEREIEVTVSITLSKTVKVLVDDYEVNTYAEDDGSYQDVNDYSVCNLEEAVENQIYLPQDAGYLINEYSDKPNKLNEISKDLSDWNVDDFNVTLEE